jgi:uncharacterized membrane protein YedE/YeeE
MSQSGSKPWNPYLAGALTGLLMVASVWVSGKYFGASTTFVRATGMIESVAAPERVRSMAYFLKEAPKVDWQFMFLAGILLGSLAASLASRTFKVAPVPDSWSGRFGPAVRPRAVAGFLGGVLAMYGARLADGCPSGHGLSGSLQLAVSGYVALACFFAGGLITARLVFGGK